MFKQLADTKSADKKYTLLHFIVQTVDEKFKDISDFDSELKYIEKAASGLIHFLCCVSLKCSERKLHRVRFIFFFSMCTYQM